MSVADSAMLDEATTLLMAEEPGSNYGMGRTRLGAGNEGLNWQLIHQLSTFIR